MIIDEQIKTITTAIILGTIVGILPTLALWGVLCLAGSPRESMEHSIPITYTLTVATSAVGYCLSKLPL